MKKTLSLVLTLSVLIILLITCKKKPEVETYSLEILNETVEVTTHTATITATYAFPTDISDIKVVVSEYQNMSNAIRIPAIIGNNTLNAVIENLQMNTRYYYCYRYSNNVNVVDTETRSFITLNATIPTVTTLAITNITNVSATCEGNVTNDGGVEVTERGVCWSKNNNPTIGNTHVSNGMGVGTFTTELTDLTVNTRYYVKTYAKNSMGIAYGEEMSFTTLENATVPVVSTGEISNITQTSALASGNVSSSGGENVTERGICWSTTHNPTTTNNHLSSGSGTGGFTVNITGLSANVTYYVRAYAVNSVGTSYGNEVSFITTQNTSSPTVTTFSVSNITQNTANCGGNVTSDGGATVTARGICWSTSHNPTTNNSYTTDGSGTGNFTSNMTGLNANTTYYVRAYATNSIGTSYGNEVSFTTSQNVNTPTVTTSSIINITQTAAAGGGNVTSAGNGTVTARGVCWSTSQNPTISNSHTTDGSGTGSFTSSLTGLTANTTYYVRAYATNSAGTAYGTQKVFTTSSNITTPTVTTNNITNITATTATCGGNVTSNGGSTVTARGVCWSTSSNPSISNSHTTDGSGTGNFTSSITGLTPNTTYYVRAYATNSVGTSYGNVKSFQTSDYVTLLNYNFNNYQSGLKIAQTIGVPWTTWNNAPGGVEDGVFGYIYGSMAANFTYGNDQVLLFGDQSYGIYNIEFDVYVPYLKNGYFNILHSCTPGNPNQTVWAMQVYLHITNDGQTSTIAYGHGTVHAGGNGVADLPCVYNSWMHFRIYINTYNDIAQLYLDGTKYAEWQWSLDCFGENIVGSNISAIDFFPCVDESSSVFYIDNFVFTQE